MSRFGHTLVISVIVLATLTTRASAQPAPTFDARWADLVSPEEAKATRAVLALAATPKETMAFLKDNLKPVKADPKRVAELLKQLDSSSFGQRNRATMELEYLNKYIKSDLEAALKKKDLLVETQMRIQQLLDKMPKETKLAPPVPVMPKGRNVSVTNINGEIRILIDGQPLNLTPLPPAPPPPGPPAQWIRAVRAVTLLEHLATPEARAMIEAMANGEADALPTIAAKEALGRLKK